MASGELTHNLSDLGAGRVTARFCCFPRMARRAWGRNANKLVVNKAIETLPPDIREFFESNRALLSQHVTDPLDSIAKTAAEKPQSFSVSGQVRTISIRRASAKLQSGGHQIWQDQAAGQRLAAVAGRRVQPETDGGHEGWALGRSQTGRRDTGELCRGSSRPFQYHGRF